MNDQKVPTGDEKNTETEEEEMEHESADSEKSSDGEDIESGSDDHDEGSDEESSDLDEEDCERRRNECILDMVELERQFFELKDQLYRERLNEVEAKLEEVAAGRAHEYLNPLAQLQENMSIRTQVAGILRELRIQAISNKFDCEQLAAYQHMESEKKLLYDGVKEDLEDRVRRLEEDRHNIDISSDLWNETEKQKRTKKSRFDPFSTDRRKKPVTVSGPYVIYMLKDVDIIEDWTAIKKAIKQQNQKRKSDYF